MNPRLLHAALVRRSEVASDRFFVGLLGLARRREKSAPAAVARALFGRDHELRMVTYGNEQLEVEVFLSEEPEPRHRHLSHLCLEVDDAPALLARCAAAGLEVRRVPHGESEVVFVADEDGNLFEIKGRRQPPAQRGT